MKNISYIDLLIKLGIDEAHPGGFQLTKQIISQLPIHQNTKLLEVGCGLGKTASYIYNKYKCEITVIELHDDMLNYAKKYFQAEKIPIRLIKGNAEKLLFPKNSFEIILSESVTAFTNLNFSLKEYNRVLVENGILVAIEMTIEWNLSDNNLDEIKCVYGVKHILTELEWKQWFYKNGFKSVNTIGGSTIALSKVSQIHPKKFNNLSKEYQNIFWQHQQIGHKYKDILGYRVFICQK